MAFSIENAQGYSSTNKDKIKWYLSHEPVIGLSIMKILATFDIPIPKNPALIIKILRRYSKKNQEYTVAGNWFEADFFEHIAQSMPEEQQLSLYYIHFMAILFERMKLPGIKEYILNLKTDSTLDAEMTEYGSRQSLTGINEQAITYAKNVGDQKAIKRYRLEAAQTNSMLNLFAQQFNTPLSTQEKQIINSILEPINNNTYVINWANLSPLTREKLSTINITRTTNYIHKKELYKLIQDGLSFLSLIELLLNCSFPKTVINQILSKFGFYKKQILINSPISTFTSIKPNTSIWLGPAYYSVMPTSEVHGIFSVNHIHQLVLDPNQNKWLIIRYHDMSQISHQQNLDIMHDLLSSNKAKLAQNQSLVNTASEEKLMTFHLLLLNQINPQQLLRQINQPYQRDSLLSLLNISYYNTETIIHTMSPSIRYLSQLWVNILNYELTKNQLLSTKQKKKLQLLWKTVIDPIIKRLANFDQQMADIIYEIYQTIDTLNEKEFIQIIKDALKDNSNVNKKPTIASDNLLLNFLHLLTANPTADIGQSTKWLSIFVPCPSLNMFSAEMVTKTSIGKITQSKAIKLIERNICPFCNTKLINGKCPICRMNKTQLNQHFKPNSQNKSTIIPPTNLPDHNNTQNRQTNKNKKNKKPVGISYLFAGDYKPKATLDDLLRI